MNLIQTHLLTLLVFLPLAGSLVIICLPANRKALLYGTATAFGFAELLLGLMLFAGFRPENGGAIQFTEHHRWIPAINVEYYLGVDGLSMPLVALTALLLFLSLMYSWVIKERHKEYFALFLLLGTGMIGTFCALDFFLFYVFWEVSLVPMYFLIGIWGQPKDRPQYSAIKFFLYTLVGSVAMLLAILACYFNAEPHTFNMMELAQRKPFLNNATAAGLCFWAFYLAFAIKVPAFPFHTWLPDAHVAAPTAGSVILAGILLKMGCYGLVRVNLPMFPGAANENAVIVAVIGLIGIIYGSLCAMAQKDLKKLVAYSSIGHMGFVMLGVGAAAAVAFPTGNTAFDVVRHEAQVAALNGATLQMVNHGLITGALFFLVGVIYERAHHRDIEGFGGLGAKVPVYTGVFVYISLASLGLPGLSGFVGEFLALLGSFAVFKLITGLAVLGVVLCAAYFLWTIQRIFLGKLNPSYEDLTDMNQLEKLTFAPLVLLIFVFGVYPQPILGPINAAMTAVVDAMQRFAPPSGLGF